MPLDPRWDSKESLHRTLFQLAKNAGCTIAQLGSAASQCWEIARDGNRRVLVAVKESGRKREKESATIWVGIPPPVLSALVESIRAGVSPPPAFVLLIDYWSNNLVVVPLEEAIGVGEDWAHPSFDLKKATFGSDYAIQTPRCHPDIPIKYINTLVPVLDALGLQG